MIVHPETVSQLSSFSSSQVLPTLKDRRLKRTTTINNGKVRVNTKNQPMELLRISENQTYTINYQVPYALPYTLLVEPGAINLEVKANNFPKVVSTQILDTSQFIQLSDWRIEQKQLSFSIQVDGNALQPGVYLFTVDVQPEKLQSQAWWQS